MSQLLKEIEIPKEFQDWAIERANKGGYPQHPVSCFIAAALTTYKHLHPSPSPSGWIDEVIKMRDNATKMVNKLKYADDTEDDFSELNFYHGQQVALNQVLEFIKHAYPNPPTSGGKGIEFVNR